MTQREIVGPQERFERLGAQRLRDIRPITTRLWSAMVGEFSGVVLAGGAMAMFVEPALVNFVRRLRSSTPASSSASRDAAAAPAADRGYQGLELSLAGRPPPAHGGGVDLSRERSQRPGAWISSEDGRQHATVPGAPPGRAKRRRYCHSWRTR